MLTKDFLKVVKDLRDDYDREKHLLKEKYNKMYLDLVPVYPYFKVGDYVKVKKSKNNYYDDEPNEFKIYLIKEVIPPNLFDYKWRYSNFNDESFIEYTYTVTPILSNYAESKKTDEIVPFPRAFNFELFVGGTKLTKSKDSFENWIPVDLEEINVIRLYQQVSNILNRLNDKRVNEQLNKYSKQSFISKKMLQETPELMYIHENIEHLKKFKTHIKTIGA